MARKERKLYEAVNNPTYKPKDCKLVTFKKRGGAKVHVWRCKSRKLKAHNRRQCRSGKGRSFKAQRFVKCAR